MIEKHFESKRLIFKPFKELNEEEKKVVGDSWANPFNARYNSMRDPYKSVEEMCGWDEPTEWGNWYRVAFLKNTSEIVGTCRFGKYHDSENFDIWDFGFNVVLKHWFNGYGAEMVAKIIGLAKDNGAKTMIGGADIENFGSYKAMVRNGFKFCGYDDDGDYRYTLDLTSDKVATKEEIERTWVEHLMRAEMDFGKEKFARLNDINLKIAEMVKRIQQGEDEGNLVKEYFNKLNEIEEFKFS